MCSVCKYNQCTNNQLLYEQLVLCKISRLIKEGDMLLDSSQYNICFIRAGVVVSAREFRFHKKKVFYICCAKFLLYYVLANNFKKVFLIPESNLFHHSSFQQFFFSLIIIVHFIRRNLFNHLRTSSLRFLNLCSCFESLCPLFFIKF